MGAEEARVCEACGEPATATVETFFEAGVHYFCAEHDLPDLPDPDFPPAQPDTPGGEQT